MKGVAGVVAPDDIQPGHAEYERNCSYMTDEASAADRGFLTAEPDAEIVIIDAHADFRNFLPDRLAAGCTLLSGSPRRHAMMTRIEQGVDAACFIGYHGNAGTPASSLHPDKACGRIQAAAENALKGKLKATAPRFDGPVELEVDMLRPSMTEWSPGAKLRAPLTVGFTATTYAAAYELIDVFTVLAAAG